MNKISSICLKEQLLSHWRKLDDLEKGPMHSLDKLKRKYSKPLTKLDMMIYYVYNLWYDINLLHVIISTSITTN